MGIAYTVEDERFIANQRVITLEATFDTDYSTGGEDLTPSDLADIGIELDTIEHVDIVEGTTAKGYVPRWDKANDTIQAFEAAADGNPLDEVAAGKNDLTDETIQLRVWGRS